MQDETQSNDPAWIDNHTLEAGDEIVTEHGEVWEITSIDAENDAYNVRRIDDGRLGPNDRDTWSGKAMQNEFVFNGSETGDGRDADAVIKHY